MGRPRIKKGDEVIVISGKDLGARGRVLEVLPKKDKVLVEGVNRITRHERIRMAQGRRAQEGGIVHKEAPIHISNVALVDPSEGKGTRIGYRIEEGTGAKTRISRLTGTEL